jgi:hypothetical protein
MKTIRVPIPKSPDPFINAALITLGVDGKGRERFWISSCNGGQGSTGIVLDEDGNYRLYRLNKPIIEYCYCAAPENEDTLWLSVGLAQVARLNLKTGAYTLYPTGAGKAFVCCGGALDPATGKFFSLGYLNDSEGKGTTAVSFDVKTKKAIVHSDVAPDEFMYTCHRIPDGTYIAPVVCPGISLIQWDPQTETIEYHRLLEQPEISSGHPQWIVDDHGRPYFPGRGWYDIKTKSCVTDGPKPEREAMWFQRQGNLAIGYEGEPSGGAVVYAWDLSTGKVRRVVSIPACYAQGIILTRSGKLVSFNTYGEFRRHDIATGRLELYRRPPTDVVQPGFRLLRLDRKRLIGAGFITQRFWEANVKTGKGFDCGQAAPGGGQVEHFWKIGGKVYLTSYGTGNLLEYDPKLPPRFPENPHVVAEPPGSMRPTCYADDGRHLYYACNTHYGKLGSTVTKYDTRTGHYLFHVNPVKDQSIHRIWLDRQRQTLLCHTAFRADGNSCPPTTDITYHLRLNAADLSIMDAVPLPRQIHASGIIGPLDQKTFLCKYDAEVNGKPWQPYLVVIDRERFTPPEAGQLLEPPAKMWSSPADIWHVKIFYAGRPGIFVLYRDKGVELWDMRKWKCLKLFRKDPQVLSITVQGRSIYLNRSRDIVILEDVL